MIFVNLFLVFFRISLFAVGGAYSFLPLIEKEVVEKYRWLSREEFLNVLGATRTLPGAISIHFATYTGYKMAGVPGMLLANLANLLSPMLMVFCASVFYIKYKNLPMVKSAFSVIQLVMFAMIISVAFTLLNINQLIQPRNILIIIIAFLLFIYAKVSPIWIIILAALFGILFKW